VIPRGSVAIVTIGASAGGVEALIGLFEKLPAGMPAVIAVVIHRHATYASQLVDVLSRHSSIPVLEPVDGQSIEQSHIYLAPRNLHLLMEPTRFRLNAGPKQHLLVNPEGTLSLAQSELVHFVRPSADLLFESVAGSFKHRAIAVVLSGSGSDGSMGVQAIKKMGGPSSPRTRQRASSSQCRTPRFGPGVSTSSCPSRRFPRPW
jgi:two-component system, chemotaxis family, protein-glutamate methylesterase/glutaminase